MDYSTPPSGASSWSPGNQSVASGYSQDQNTHSYPGSAAPYTAQQQYPQRFRPGSLVMYQADCVHPGSETGVQLGTIGQVYTDPATGTSRWVSTDLCILSASHCGGQTDTIYQSHWCVSSMCRKGALWCDASGHNPYMFLGHPAATADSTRQKAGALFPLHAFSFASHHVPFLPTVFVANACLNESVAKRFVMRRKVQV